MDAEESTRHVLQGRELIDYLVEKASSTTNAELVQREDRRNRRSTVVFSVITFIGISGLIGVARLFIDSAVQERTKEFRAEMTRNSEALERRISAMHLETQAFQKLLNDQMTALSTGMQQQVRMHVAEEASRGLLLLKQRERFQTLKQFIGEIKEQVAENKLPESLITSAIDIVSELAEAPGITAEPEYGIMVETLVHQLVRYDRIKDVNRLEQATRDICTKSSAIAVDLTDHFGQLIISSPYPVEQMPGEFDALTRYARASRELQYPERSLMWELFVEFKRGKFTRSTTTDELVEMIDQLQPVDLRNFAYYVFMYSHPLHWEHTPDQEGRTLARLVETLLSAYPELRETVATQIASPELKPTIDGLLAFKAEREEQVAQRTTTPVSTEQAAGESTGSAPPNELRR